MAIALNAILDRVEFGSGSGGLQLVVRDDGSVDVSVYGLATSADGSVNRPAQALLNFQADLSAGERAAILSMVTKAVRLMLGSVPGATITRQGRIFIES